MAIPLLIFRRLLALVPLLVLISFMVFCLVLLIPGDPAVTIAGDNPTVEQVAEIRHGLGLDRPLLDQYWSWGTSAVHGDLGASLNSSRQVTTAINDALPVTLSLTIVAFLLGCSAGTVLGLVAGVRPGKLIDRITTLFCSLSLSVPHFWLALILLSTFAINRSWLPVGGFVPLTEDPFEWLKHLILPAVALAAGVGAEVARQTRSAMIESMSQDFVRTARSKGLSPTTVAVKHAFRNAALPTVNVVGLQFNRIFGSAVVIESIFGLPGIGRLAITAVYQRDVRMIQGIVLLSAVLVILVNLAVDVVSSWLNPQIRQA